MSSRISCRTIQAARVQGEQRTVIPSCSSSPQEMQLPGGAPLHGRPAPESLLGAGLAVALPPCATPPQRPLHQQGKDDRFSARTRRASASCVLGPRITSSSATTRTRGPPRGQRRAVHLPSPFDDLLVIRAQSPPSSALPGRAGRPGRIGVTTRPCSAKSFPVGPAFPDGREGSAPETFHLARSLPGLPALPGSPQRSAWNTALRRSFSTRLVVPPIHALTCAGARHSPSRSRSGRLHPAGE